MPPDNMPADPIEFLCKDSKVDFKNIINFIGSPIFVKDRQHRWVMFNNAFCSLMGHTSDELRGKTDTDFFSADQAEVFWVKDEEVFQSKKESVNEEFLTDAQGCKKTVVTKKTLYIDPSGEEFIVGVIEDITERNKLEALIRRSKEQMMALLDGIPDLVWLKDNGGKCIAANKPFAQTFGLKIEQVIGKNDHELWPQELALKYVQEDAEVMATKARKMIVDQIVSGDGNVELFEIIKTPILNLNGAVVGVSGIAHNITHRRRAEEALLKSYEDLKKAKDQLVQSEKMASIGQLAAGVAHEINNPVGYISSNLEVMVRYMSAYLQMVELVDKLKGAVDRKAWTEVEGLMGEIETLKEVSNLNFIVEDSQILLKQSQEGMMRIEKIVSDLKNFSREETRWADDRVQIEDIWDAALNLTNNELKYKVDLKRNYGLTPPVQCSVQKMQQVFINLLTNAAQAIQERGTVEITTYEKNGRVVSEISDSGVGISQENMKRVFDPFFTTKPAGKGTGLGLSISYELVKKQKGEITVMSQPGQGTTFIISLPLPAQKIDVKT
jgi:PAS domain S-box-containing protein